MTEYGVHWNFFFTLGLLPVLGTILLPLRRNFLRWTPMAILVVAGAFGKSVLHAKNEGQRIALSQFGLQSWVLSPVRQGLLGANKEGLVSLPGYLAIYLLGLAIGQHVLRSSVHQDRRKTELAMELVGYSIGFWASLVACRVLGAEVSRRLVSCPVAPQGFDQHQANMPYILWTAAYNTTFLLLYLLVELVLDPPTPPLLDAINTNGLVVFLVANLLTGLINVSVQTMYIGDMVAMVILVLYSLGVCAFAWSIRHVRLKL